jgi:CheY-like chemotaxis protein
VHDSGLGIAADDLPRIFEEFYQVGNKARDRRQGLGLGLATAKRMSDLLGLGLAVQSQPGQGSAFSVVLPLGDAADLATQPESGLGAGHDVAHGRRVLVIEDDEVSRQAMRQLLENWGCQVHAAANAPQALAWVEQGYRPECVLADLRLGDGLDGGQIVQRVRALLGARLPALLITGDTATASVRSAEHSGLAMLRKPIKPAQLRAFINEAFAQRG